MKLEDLIVFLPAAVMATVTKTIRTKIPENTKQYIEKNHLYHCTGSKEVAEKIMESGYIKPSTGIFTNINSYGVASCCMFAGMPTIGSFVKNMTVNPYIEPDKIVHAIELDIKKEEMNNYKIRPFSDEAILYEGWCVLPENRTKIVEMVADLKRDKDGKPIINEKTGKALRNRA